MPLEHAQQLKVGRAPELDRPVLRRARDHRIVRRHRHAVHVLFVRADTPSRRLQQGRRRPPPPFSTYSLRSIGTPGFFIVGFKSGNSGGGNGQRTRVPRLLFELRESAAGDVPALDCAIRGTADDEGRGARVGRGRGGPRARLARSGDCADGVRVSRPSDHGDAEVEVPQKTTAVFRGGAQVPPGDRDENKQGGRGGGGGRG